MAIAFLAIFISVTTLWCIIDKVGGMKYPYWLFAFLPPLIWLFMSKTLGLFTVVGISYFTFRISHLVWEMQLKRIKNVSYALFIAHVFFLPTFLLGPISPFSYFISSFYREDKTVSPPIYECLLRMLKGAVKYVVVAGVFLQLAPDSYLGDYRVHKWYEFFLAAYAFYIYLYMNFSGANDISIGAAGLMGVSVMENFNRPYLARSVTEFWGRWHISLSEWMRDIVFFPMVAYLLHHQRWIKAYHAVGVSLMLIFILIGWWHGNGWQYWVIGIMFGIAVTTEHYSKVYAAPLNFIKVLDRHDRSFGVLKWCITHTYLAITVSFMSVDWAEKGITFGGMVSRVYAALIR